MNDLAAELPPPRLRQPRADGEGRYVYFRVDPAVRPLWHEGPEDHHHGQAGSPGKKAGMKLTYESAKGYRGANGWWTIPEDDQWHEHTWKVTDANFVGQWGWNFRFDAIGSPDEFLVKEVHVKKAVLVCPVMAQGARITREPIPCHLDLSRRVQARIGRGKDLRDSVHFT